MTSFERLTLNLKWLIYTNTLRNYIFPLFIFLSVLYCINKTTTPSTVNTILRPRPWTSPLKRLSRPNTSTGSTTVLGTVDERTKTIRNFHLPRRRGTVRSRNHTTISVKTFELCSDKEVGTVIKTLTRH